MRAGVAISSALLGQYGHLFQWSPVFFASGIGLFFSLTSEPGSGLLAGRGVCGVGLCLWARRMNAVGRALLWALALFLLGFAVAGARTAQVGGPVLGFRYYGPVEGTVVGIDRSASDALRLTLSDVVLSRVDPDRAPLRVRVSLHGPTPEARLEPGERVIMTAHLSPPSGPVEPGGFDFQRHAWFLKLGAVGYTRAPVLQWAPPRGGFSIFALRMKLSRAIRDRLGGEVGGFAAAVTTGDRSGISQSTLQDLRTSNLAHLLAISGLHMGLLVGFVFWAARAVLALVPALALRVSIKKVAALVALVAASGYLALSGGNIATERAFIMAAVALVAVLMDRRALTLRAVAVAAMIVLALRPEALMSPGFQMSFAATTALVAVFSMLRDFERARVPRWLRGVMGVVLSSLVAGLATAPVAAAHFNQISHFGLVANLLSVPLMGVLVVPAAVLAGLLALFGAEMLGLWPMGWGLRWILGVAETVAEWEGKAGAVAAPAGWVLPVLSLGAIFAVLWQGPWRGLGVIPVVVAFAGWHLAERPVALIADSGGLVGITTPAGRALSRDKGQGFVARVWLENDGEVVDQEGAAARWPAQGPVDIGDGLRLRHVAGKRAAEAFDACEADEIVVFSVPFERDMPCRTIDPLALLRTGSIAFYARHNGIEEISARQSSGMRRWTSWKDQ